MAKKSSGHSGWDAICKDLQAAADPAVAERYKQIAPTTGTVLGITVPNLRTMVKEFAAANKGLAVAEAASMADIAFASACREEMLFAIFLLARFKTKFQPEHWDKVNGWIDGIDNWETCDQLAMGVAGEMIGRAAEQLRAKWVRDLEKWAGAANPWRRRFAVATTTVLNQKGRSDAQAALCICERVIADSDKTVQKAVGWALREACKSDATAVFSLLKKHQAAMPRGVLRESAEKLTPTQRKALGLG